MIFFMDPWCLHVAKLLVKCQALTVVLFIFFIACSQTLVTGIEKNGMLLSYKFSGLLADFGSFYEAF